MHKTLLITLYILLFVACKSVKNTSSAPNFSQFITKADQSLLLSEQTTKFEAIAGVPEITFDESKTFQEIDGFGFTLTEGSAWAIHQKLTENAQNELLKELFSPENMNFSFLRITIGASDMNHFVYTYDDLADNETDVNLSKFNLGEDYKDIIPVLKKIIAINPKIKILGSPWTAPKWMKAEPSYIGASLKPEFYSTYAQYFVKYIQTMQNEGIPIYAITIQNEPENPSNNPSMLMNAKEQAEFIKTNLGPAFEKYAINTKIILFDHNCDHPTYPISVLNDPLAKKFVDGSAFHLYAGDISALSTVQAAHPDKNIYFTEQWNWTKGKFAGDLIWGVKNLLIGSTRNWSKTALKWNLASDQNYKPFTDHGGCGECLPAVTVMDDGTVNRNVAYYTLGHAAKFLPVGSKRIFSSGTIAGLSNVAFIKPNGQKVMIVLNENNSKVSFKIVSKSISINAELPAASVATFVWN